jgi:hypothetical protein
MHHLVAALPVLVGIALTMGACTSLKTKRFADDPTFPETASKIELTVHKPANVHATRKYSFTSTQQETGSAAERMMDITWDASAQLAFGYDSQRHTLVLVDHSNGRTYEISGETAVMRSALEVSEGVSEETDGFVVCPRQRDPLRDRRQRHPVACRVRRQLHRRALLRL